MARYPQIKKTLSRITKDNFQHSGIHTHTHTHTHTSLDTLERIRGTLPSSPFPQEVQHVAELVNGDFSPGRWKSMSELLVYLVCRMLPQKLIFIPQHQVARWDPPGQEEEGVPERGR